MKTKTLVKSLNTRPQSGDQTPGRHGNGLRVCNKMEWSSAVGRARRSARAAKPTDHGAHGMTRPTARRILFHALNRFHSLAKRFAFTSCAAIFLCSLTFASHAGPISLPTNGEPSPQSRAPTESYCHGTRCKPPNYRASFTIGVNPA